jgi:hypothetical protein
MPNFKPKTAKKIKINKKKSVTLDGKHREIINEFSHNDNDVIPELKREKKHLKNILKEDTNITIEQKLDIQDRIMEIKQTINEIQYNKKKYFLDNVNHIFDYFENKKDISNGLSNVNNKSKILNNFFKLKDEDDNSQELQQQNINKNIVQKYLNNIDTSHIDMSSYISPSDVCRYCNQGELIPIEDEGILVCNKCARNVPYLIENEKQSYKEPPKEVCFYAYKRINHFKEILAQFQGKETTQIHPSVIENIKLQIKKERINQSQITNEKTKEILKKLGYNKYYEHIPFIKDKLGIKPPVMSPELEEKLCNFFIDLQAPYSKFCPDNRVNFLNYYYTAYKLCELLGETQYLPLFPLLKDPYKRVEQDMIWKKICEELDWEFIPTI